MTNQPLSVLIDQAQALLAEIAAHPDHLQLLELGWSPDLHIADAQTALIYLDWEIQPESEAIAPTTNHCNRPTKYVSLAAKTKVHKDSNK